MLCVSLDKWEIQKAVSLVQQLAGVRCRYLDRAERQTGVPVDSGINAVPPVSVREGSKPGRDAGRGELLSVGTAWPSEDKVSLGAICQFRSPLPASHEEGSGQRQQWLRRA